MIKSIEDVFDEAFAAYECRHPNGWEVTYQEILRQWALSIIQECVDNAEYSMEEDDETNEGSSMDDLGRKLQHPVLHRESINRVKQQIQ